MTLHTVTVLAIPGSVHDLCPDAVPGVNDPLIAIAATTDGKRVEIVLKPTSPWLLPNGRHIPGETMNLREVVCSMLLRALGIPAPEPFVVVGSAIPWDVLVPAHASRLHSQPHFASELIINARECAAGERLSRIATALRDKAEILFAADNMIVNCDRTKGKPNLWWRSDALIPIDHGLAFELLGSQPDALGIPAGMQRNHAIYDFLETIRPNFASALQSWLNLLTPSTLDAIEAALPAQWVADRSQLDLIRNHLQAHPRRIDAITSAMMQTFRP